MAEEKYKMFRQYMANELGIGRAEIREWTEEVIRMEVRRVWDQLGVDSLIKTEIRKLIYSTMGGPTNVFRDALRDAIGKEISGRIHLTNPEA